MAGAFPLSGARTLPSAGWIRPAEMPEPRFGNAIGLPEKAMKPYENAIPASLIIISPPADAISPTDGAIPQTEKRISQTGKYIPQTEKRILRAAQRSCRLDKCIPQTGKWISQSVKRISTSEECIRQAAECQNPPAKRQRKEWKRRFQTMKHHQQTGKDPIQAHERHFLPANASPRPMFRVFQKCKRISSNRPAHFPARRNPPPHWLHAVPPLTTKLRLLAVATATLRAARRFDRLPFDFAQGLSLSNGKARSPSAMSAGPNGLPRGGSPFAFGGLRWRSDSLRFAPLESAPFPAQKRRCPVPSLATRVNAMPFKEWTIELDDARIYISRHTQAGVVISFAVVLIAWTGDEWECVTRYDCAHGFPHRDVLGKQAGLLYTADVFGLHSRKVTSPCHPRLPKKLRKAH